MSVLTDLADDYYEYRQSTDAGRLMWDGSLEHLEKWEDVAPAAIALRQQTLREFADRAEQVEIDEADPTHVALRDAIVFTARAEAINLQWSVELTEVNPNVGLVSLAAVFATRFPLVTTEHGDLYLAKMRALPAVIDDLVAAVQAAALEGRVAPARHLRASADAVEAYLAGPGGADDPFAAQAPPTQLTDAVAWRSQLSDIVASDVRPALERYGQALRAVAERGRDDDHVGLVHLEGGIELYRQRMWSMTSLSLEPEDIHRQGIAIISTLEQEYQELGDEVFGTADINDVYSRLRDDHTLHYSSADDIVRDAHAALAKASAVAPQWFSRLPESGCVPVATASGPVAFYSPPSPADGTPGEFFFNTADPAAWSSYELEAIAYHESIPGHHLQFALHAEDTTLHPVLKHLHVTAYLEGWGLYTERLADEMGLYETPLSRMGMLAADSLRACRLVVDTGVHALGWSRQRAIDYMAAHCPLSLQQIVAEVDRYIGDPGQALAYMIGRNEIQSIRSEAEQRPGFDICVFHDAVLRHGMVPLTSLRSLVLDLS